jgi:hypothetical protein
MWQWWDEYPVFDFARNARCTVTTDLFVWYSNTQNDFSPAAAISSLHTLASPSGRNVNYDEKQLTGGKKLSSSFYLYRYRKYVSYGFPIINFCNPGVHYETPCIYMGHKSEGSGFDSRWCHWNFSFTYSFRLHYGPGVDPASNRNEYQEYFLGVKAAGA